MNSKTKSNFDTEIHTVCIKFIMTRPSSASGPGSLSVCATRSLLFLINFIQTVWISVSKFCYSLSHRLKKWVDQPVCQLNHWILFIHEWRFFLNWSLRMIEDKVWNKFHGIGIMRCRCRIIQFRCIILFAFRRWTSS